MPIEAFDDGLVIPEVGSWSKDKYHLLGRYLDAFTTAMKGKPWSALYYLDLFAGAGFVRLRESRGIVCGSPVIAANTRFPFTQIRAAERDPVKAAALANRLARAGLPIAPLVQVGDANSTIDAMLEGIKPNSLSMAFIDPYGLHVSFETVAKLSNVRSDLLVLFPDHMDVLRNWEEYYEENPESSLDRFMGVGTNWREIMKEAPEAQRAQRLRELYQNQLSTLGYSHFDSKRISRADGRQLYVLIFASRSDVGLKLWRRIGAVDSGGQRGFDF